MADSHKVTVSLGLPVFNGEEFLAETLNSILAQSFADFELIIGDNASSDRTEHICREYASKDKRIHYVRHERNLGAAPNYNQVFALASGRFFKWIAYDDPIEPEFLERCVTAMNENEAAVLCFTKAQMIDEQSRPIGESQYVVDVYQPQAEQRFKNITLALSEVAKVPIPVFGLMRRETMQMTALIGSFPSSDVVFLAEMSLYGPFCVIPEPLLLWRHHPRQSVKGELASDRQRVYWFNTSLQGKIILPKWRYLRGYLVAIKNAPVSWFAKLQCLLVVLRWSMKLPNAKAMVKDLALAAVAWPDRHSLQRRNA